jgi:hypothetical protein
MEMVACVWTHLRKCIQHKAFRICRKILFSYYVVFVCLAIVPNLFICSPLS